MEVVHNINAHKKFWGFDSSVLHSLKLLIAFVVTCDDRNIKDFETCQGENMINKQGNNYITQ